jgi:hypothetical protein
VADRIIVRGALFDKPLLDTDKAVAIEFRSGPDSELVALAHKVFGGDVWTVTTKSDPDWANMLWQLGYGGRFGGVVDLNAKPNFFK